MKKFKKIFVTLGAVAAAFAVCAAGCKPDNSNEGEAEGDGYTYIELDKAVEFIADYAEQFLASDNSTIIYDSDSSFTGKFKSVSDSNGNLKKIAKMNGATKATYEYLNGEKAFYEMLNYNGYDMLDGSGAKITSGNDSGGILKADGILYDMQYIDGDYYAVIHNDSDGLNLQNYMAQYRNQAAIYLCECAMFISLVADGDTQSATSVFVERGILSTEMVSQLKTMTVDTSVLQMSYAEWGEGETEVKTKYEIAYVKYLGNELKVQTRMVPDNEGIADPAMEGESKNTFTFNYAAGLDEEHFNGIINKTAPLG